MQPFYWDPAKSLALELTEAERKTLRRVMAVKSRPLSQREYDKRFSQLTDFHTPQTHILAKQGLFWVVWLCELDEKGGTTGGSNGIHILLLRSDGMSYAWIPPEILKRRPSFLALVEKGWFWWLGEYEDADSRLLTEPEERFLKDLVG